MFIAHKQYSSYHPARAEYKGSHSVVIPVGTYKWQSYIQGD